jgi:hypothetical protein
VDSIRIETGVKRIAINDDPNRVIEFNPSDIAFAERFYKLLQNFEVKQAEYEKRAGELDDQTLDEHGIPSNIGPGLAFLREVCEYLRGEIDHLFGPNTSQQVFGDALTLDMFEQFFVGITPFVQQTRQEKLARYTQSSRSKRVMK